jgi:hypothetical protein
MGNIKTWPFAVLALLGPTLSGGQTVNGRLVDAITRQPVIGAEVRLVQGERILVSAASDSLGRFIVSARQPGRYQLIATRIGYGEVQSQFVELSAAQTVNAELQMSSEAVKLAPLTLEVTRDTYLEGNGFYERLKTGTGDFLTTEQIQRRNTHSLVELLRGLRGVKVLRNGVKQEVYFSSGSCLPMIVVDGVTVRWGGRTTGMLQPLDDLVTVAHISAVESYRGGSGVPPEFIGPQAACGVILIWTRHK